jgi:hypothetical protein
MSPSAVLVGVLKVFLDCSGANCYEDYLREEVEIADYVRDRTDADVHVLVTVAETGAGGLEFTLAFIGQGAFQQTSRTLTVTTEASDSEDRIRRRLESALTIGLLSYLSPDRVPEGLQVTGQFDAGVKVVQAASDDPWNRWTFSVNGSMDFEAEESTSERNWGLSVGADRITPDWKLTFGTDFFESREEFELDEGERLTATSSDRSFNALAVKSLDQHWSLGLTGRVRSSTFDNLELEVRLAPGIEWNFFPYAMYTRRQFRVLYEIGGSRMSYNELTLYDKFDETRALQELSGTYEQREPWGTLEGRVIASNFFPGFDAHRIELDGEVNLRILRGLSLNVEASVSRIRDQLSLPRRDASEEEVLLRLRQLQSGFETRLELGIEYRFGSPFAAIVNPRFGQ